MEVYNREVFYLSGYDPRGYRFYFSLFQKELKKQNAITQKSFNITNRDLKGKGNLSWKVEDRTAQTNYHYLSWDDIIRKNWTKNHFKLIVEVLYFIKAYLFTGIYKTFAKESKKQLLAGFYPLIFVILSLFIIFFASGIIGLLVNNYSNSILGCVAFFFVFYALFKWMIHLGNQYAVFWLSRIYAFCAKFSLNEIAHIDERTIEFAQEIFTALKQKQNEKNSEILVVSHSVGTILAIPVIYEIIRLCKSESIDYSKLKLITLGECIPLVSFQKNAQAFNSKMQAIENDDKLLWVDYTSAIDGACFLMLNPLKASGLELNPKNSVRVLSTRFFKLFTKERYQRLRRDWFQVHFLYLMATDYQGEYDYFDITVGSNSLESKIPS